MGESPSNIDIRPVRVFCTVVRCGGMAAAELELNIGRSTIGRHVKELEQRLGYTLCHRGRSGFSLTPEGQHVYQAAERMLAALDQFNGDTLNVREQVTGRLSIALFDKTVTNPNAYIHEAIAKFHDLAPAVAIDISVSPINEIERRVIEGADQLGIIPTHRNSSSLRYLPLFGEQMYLYCAPQHPLFARSGAASKQEILASNYAGIGFHSPNMEVGTALEWPRRATGYDQEAIATLIRSGRYVGFLPEHYAELFVQKQQMRRLGDDTFQYRCEFAAIYRQTPRPSRMLALFLECLSASHGVG